MRCIRGCRWSRCPIKILSLDFLDLEELVGDEKDLLLLFELGERLDVSGDEVSINPNLEDKVPFPAGKNLRITGGGEEATLSK